MCIHITGALLLSMSIDYFIFYVFMLVVSLFISLDFYYNNSISSSSSSVA